jgi:hypothetical protein
VVGGGIEGNPAATDVIDIVKDCRDLLPPYIRTEKDAWTYMANLSPEDFPCDPSNETTAANID